MQITSSLAAELSPAGVPSTLGVVPPRSRLQGKVETPLAKARAKAGVYQHELARVVGISVASYRRLERGEAPNAPVWWYTNCATALNVPLEDVLGELERSWHPTILAPKPPDIAFLNDRWAQALAWRDELPDE